MTEPVTDTTTAEAGSADEADAEAPAENADTVKEAKKYRQRAQAAEAERDTLRTRLESMQRNEVERLAAEHLKDGTDLWRDGAQLADLLDDDGNIDPDKITDVTQTLVTAHPHWRKLAPAAPPASIVTATDKIAPGEKQATWSDLLQGRNTK
ncbi:MAG: hypothetical protein WCZ29_15370 [Mycolicibacterium vanbaalenii]|uniref:hypothetical protein n=1 Tax=Mycolicibacterium vanbaalenii TaxID=110539 RepID=UPI0035671014